MTDVALPEPLLDSDEHDAVQVEMSSVQETGVVHSTDTEGCVDMGVLELNLPKHHLQSSVCKAVARLVGLTDELQEFDRIRCLCKAKGNQALCTEERLCTYACHFRKLTCTSAD